MPFSSLKSAFCLSKVYSSVFFARPFTFPVITFVTIINVVSRLSLFLTTDLCLILDYHVGFPLDGKPGVFFCFCFLPPSCPAAGQCEWQWVGVSVTSLSNLPKRGLLSEGTSSAGSWCPRKAYARGTQNYRSLYFPPTFAEPWRCAKPCWVLWDTDSPPSSRPAHPPRPGTGAGMSWGSEISADAGSAPITVWGWADTGTLLSLSSLSVTVGRILTPVNTLGLPWWLSGKDSAC